MKKLAVILALALSACASTPDLKMVVPEKVNVIVPVSCPDPAKVPAAPNIRTEAELKAMPEYQATIQLWLDHQALRDYAKRQAVIIAACAAGPKPP